jgi:hypothetical protein
VFYLLREFRKHKTAPHLKLFAILLISTMVLFLLFENIKLPLYLSVVFPFLALSIAAILVKLYRLPLPAGKISVGCFLLFILWDGIHGMGLKYEKTFDKKMPD